MRKYIYYLVFFVFAIFVSACEREDLSDLKVNILDGIAAAPDLSTLNEAIKKAGLRQNLDGTQYTFFAPTNQAFTDAGINISSLSAAQLLKILQYHMIPSRVDSSRFDLEYGLFFGQISAPDFFGQLTYQGFQTLNVDVNANIYCTNASEVVGSDLVGRGVYINGAQITQFDALEGADGVVHKINRVLLPPPGNLAQLIGQQTNLSLFNKLISKAATAVGASSFASTTLSTLPADALTTARTGTFTVLAPTDEAMIAAGYDQIFIDGASVTTLLAIARQHVFNLRTFSSDLYQRQLRGAITYTPLAGLNITFGTDTNGLFFSTAGTPRASIVSANVVANNGTLQIVDTVLE